jgi:exodeoxyribonuclease VIII
MSQYNDIKALNYSGAKQILRSPLHFQSFLNEERKDTPALRMGRLVHLASLQFDVFKSEVHVGPDVDKRSKEWKEFKASIADGVDIITADENAEITAIAKSVHGCLADLKLKDCEYEQSIDTEYNGIQIKGRPDLVAKDAEGNLVVVDVKTTTDASIEHFAKDIAAYKYHLQAAFYLKLTGATKFYLIAVEKEPPYASATYALSDDAIQEGQRLMDKAVNIYKMCSTFGNWPGYSDEVRSITIPKWAFTDIS